MYIGSLASAAMFYQVYLVVNLEVNWKPALKTHSKISRGMLTHEYYKQSSIW